MMNNLEIKQYLEEYANITPVFWYMYQDINNPYLQEYLNLGQILVEEINYCTICHYILTYNGIRTNIFTFIFKQYNNVIEVFDDSIELPENEAEYYRSSDLYYLKDTNGVNLMRSGSST